MIDQIPPALAICTRTFGGLLFGAAAFGKIRHHVAFQGVFENYRLTPPFATPVLAYGLIGAEALVALSLLTGLGLTAGALGAMALLGLFALAIAINLVRGRDDIDCGCFQSTLRQQLSWAHVVRNLAYATLMNCLLLPRAPVTSALDLVDGVGAGLAFFALGQVFESLWSLRGGVRKLVKRFG
ncbi:MauE/DoxX family redox-associated membrane protein [uncultured Caulobacter sp.]|uniref:MauE/DoxX family redox-associated membrane protein n=1 Tax=uncultured Caulobacter sp. TaxID=158749 RepID=UPI0026099A66|nr:MauE/DoxX family redox-associated membrane protein [uncultured Caulobacter sp.]